MKFHFKMEMITNRRLLIITLILFLIIIVGYATSVILLLSSSSDHVDALITVDNKNSRLGESIVFDGSNSTGDINRYFWDLGDGNTSTEEIVVHQYELAGWYNVSLKVESSNGRSSNNSIVVGVQQNDNEVYLDLPRLFWISGGRRGYYVESPLGPNIGNPTAEVNIHLEGAVGNNTIPRPSQQREAPSIILIRSNHLTSLSMPNPVLAKSSLRCGSMRENGEVGALA
jgi:hypothetical protein